MQAEARPMSDSWREPIERPLDAHPADHAGRRNLADLLEERGDPDAEPVRWLADRMLYPRLGLDGDNWSWPSAFHFPWSAPTEIMREAFRLSPTRREAEAAFCRAFHLARAEGW